MDHDNVRLCLGDDLFDRGLYQASNLGSVECLARPGGPAYSPLRSRARRSGSLRTGGTLSARVVAPAPLVEGLRLLLLLSLGHARSERTKFVVQPDPNDVVGDMG